MQAFIKRITKHREVIREYLNKPFHHVWKNVHHAPLKSGQGIAKAEQHPPISKSAKKTCECCLLLILWGYGDLIVGWISIKRSNSGYGQTICQASDQWIEKESDPNLLLCWASYNECTLSNPWSSMWVQAHLLHSSPLWYPDILGTTYTGLTHLLSEIG